MFIFLLLHIYQFSKKLYMNYGKTRWNLTGFLQKNVMGILKSSKYIETDVNFKNNIIMYITPQLIEFHKKYISFMFM